jgi:membrane-associated PAP2 superfamily phosphatase
MRHAWWPLLVILPILVGLEFTAIDQLITDQFFDSVSRSFPLRDNFWLEVVMHHWLKYLVVVVAIIVLVSWVLSFRKAKLVQWRSHLLFAFVAMVLASVTISGLKTASSKHCPNDLEMYGGYAPYTRLFDSAVEGVREGHCFPGGHSSTGFVLFAFYFVWRRRRPQLAKVALLVAIAAGMALGFGRVMQGAHFLSHQLWTAVICWYVVLFCYWLLLYRREGEIQPQQGH